MINNENIEKYFDLMKSRGFIAEYWSYDGYWNDGDHIKIHYLHKSGKRSSYRFLKVRVIEELRDNILRQLFD